MTYSMTCSCGHEMSAEAATRQDAVAKMKAMMTQDYLDQHLAEKHAGEPKITLAQAHAQVDQMLAEAPA